MERWRERMDEEIGRETDKRDGLEGWTSWSEDG